MVFVDSLLDHGWRLRGKPTKNSHLFADDLEELHAFARRLGLRRAWFQYKPGRLPHYDLTPGNHFKALRQGATLLDREAAVAKWREIKAADASRLEGARRGLSDLAEFVECITTDVCEGLGLPREILERYEQPGLPFDSAPSSPRDQKPKHLLSPE